MNYRSTRNEKGEAVSAAFAIKNGIAPDGGLYMPESIPQLDREALSALCAMSCRTHSLALSDRLHRGGAA